MDGSQPGREHRRSSIRSRRRLYGSLSVRSEAAGRRIGKLPGATNSARRASTFHRGSVAPRALVPLRENRSGARRPPRGNPVPARLARTGRAGVLRQRRGGVGPARRQPQLHAPRATRRDLVGAAVSTAAPGVSRDGRRPRPRSCHAPQTRGPRVAGPDVGRTVRAGVVTKTAPQQRP